MIAGGCLCGAVRYTASEAQKRVRMCWCRDCQYFASGSATVNAFFAAEALSFEGKIQYYDRTADSGNAMRRGFCPTYGTQITTAALARPETIGIRVGTLDDPDGAAPQSVIWAESAPSWACVDPDLPGDPGQPPPS